MNLLLIMALILGSFYSDRVKLLNRLSKKHCITHGISIKIVLSDNTFSTRCAEVGDEEK